MMKQGMRCLLLTVLLLAFLTGAFAEGELRSYSKKDGYVYVTLGRYYQTVDGGLPKEKRNTWTWSANPVKDPAGLQLEKEPLLWRVLKVDDEKAYLASEYVLFAMPMHVNYNEYKTLGADFGQTELSHYLNETFAADAFTE